MVYFYFKQVGIGKIEREVQKRTDCDSSAGILALQYNIFLLSSGLYNQSAKVVLQNLN